MAFANLAFGSLPDASCAPMLLLIPTADLPPHPELIADLLRMFSVYQHLIADPLLREADEIGPQLAQSSVVESALVVFHRSARW